MVWKPNPAAPKDMRQMFHWAYATFKSLANEIPAPAPLDLSNLEQRIQDLEAHISQLESP